MIKTCGSCNKYDENGKYLKVNGNTLFCVDCVGGCSYNKTLGTLQIKSKDFLAALANGVYSINEFESLANEKKEQLLQHLHDQAQIWLNDNFDMGDE